MITTRKYNIGVHFDLGASMAGDRGTIDSEPVPNEAKAQAALPLVLL